MDVPGLTADERVLLRVVGADPGSDWLHGFSSGHLYLTDRRLVLEPWSALGGAGRDRWELPLDAVAKVSSVPVPVWLFGVIRIWLRGLRCVSVDGKTKTVIVGRSRATECVATLESILNARRRSSRRTAAAPST